MIINEKLSNKLNDEENKRVNDFITTLFLIGIEHIARKEAEYDKL